MVNGSTPGRPKRDQSDQDDLAPRDDAPPGTPGTGQAVCPDCGGTGMAGGAPCPTCDGAGVVIRGIGGG